jgi:hypothetical protein
MEPFTGQALTDSHTNFQLDQNCPSVTQDANYEPFIGNSTFPEGQNGPMLNLEGQEPFSAIRKDNLCNWMN